MANADDVADPQLEPRRFVGAEAGAGARPVGKQQRHGDLIRPRRDAIPRWVRVSDKADYAVRAALELAGADERGGDRGASGNMRVVLEHVTLADVAEGRLPEGIVKLAAHPDSWNTR